MRRESVVRRENISGESQGDREEFQPEESKRWRRNQQGFLGSRRSSERISLIVIILTREVQLHVPRKEHILFDWIFWCHQVNLCRSRGCTRKANLWLLGCRREQKFVNIVNEFHKIYVIEWNSSEQVERTGRRHHVRPDHLWPDALTRIRKAAQRRRKQE